ncbi:energy transducer TonB [Desulfobacca acetoxidans]|uniref:TonB family protein n=1 Tax=Desulfobacca acetoxidans (strain ATCC 700848 / DSM 11109 / ASRB2) TaxID=880072 RepID=F2NEQ0_DESAR|nr:energy transducer TonB [Desulfobacca acetoxidans]AEB08240.1 TonB family protein [Desulfobacca acetoxidans DSM 11109]
MECHYQEWISTWKTKDNWTWAILGSLLVHGLLVAGMLTSFMSHPAKKCVVVPVEAIALVPGPKGGGGGRPAAATRPEAVPPKPSPVCPPARPQVKPKTVLKTRLAPPPPEPTMAPVIPTPASPPAITRGKSSPATVAACQAGSSGAAVGSSVSGQGGRGTGAGGGVGPGRGRGSGPGSGPGSALQGYLREIRRLLEKQKEYPLMARRRNIQGMVVVMFTIASGGQVDASQVSRSSGHDLLDEAARNTVRRVGRFPPIPVDLKRQKLTVAVPLAFCLNNE